MNESITEIENAREVLGQTSPWDADTRVSEDFLRPLFRSFYQKTGMAGRVSKSDYNFLVEYMEPGEIDNEVVDVLDSIVHVATNANRQEQSITSNLQSP